MELKSKIDEAKLHETLVIAEEKLWPKIRKLSDETLKEIMTPWLLYHLICLDLISDELLFYFARKLEFIATVAEAKPAYINDKWGPEIDTSKDIYHKLNSNCQSTTLLREACLHDEIDMVKYLLEHGADPVIDPDDFSDLTLDIIKLLVEHGTSLKAPVLSRVCEDGNRFDVIEYLIEHGAEMSEDCFGEYMSSIRYDLYDYLFEEKEELDKHYALYDYLLKHGANINGKFGLENWTSLMYACYYGYSIAVEYLLDRGADPNIRDENGRTAITMACAPDEYSANQTILKMLIDHGADVNYALPNGDTPLILASTRGLTKHVRILVENGAQVNAKNKEGLSSIYYACAHGHVKIVNILVNYRAEMTGDMLNTCVKKYHEGILNIIAEHKRLNCIP